MKSNFLKLSIIALIAGLFLSACGKSEPADGEAATQAHTYPNKAAPLDMQADVSQINSFVMETTLEIFDGETGDLSLATSSKRIYRSNPAAEKVVMEQTTAGAGAHGSDAKSAPLEMVTLNGVTYSLGHSAGCMTMPADDAETSSSLAFLDATSLFDTLQNAQRLDPDETVNGVESKHYRFDEAVYAPQSQDVDVEGHLYLAVSDDHLVKMTIEGVDPQMAGEEGINEGDRFRLEYNVLSVNQPVEITIPAECEEQAEANAAPARYPIVDDAYNVADHGVTLTYKTKATLNQILAFYQKTLTEQGWIYNAEGTVEGETGAIWFFERGEESLQVMAGEKQGETVVTLIEGKAEDTDETLATEPLPRMADAFDDLSLSDTEIYKTHATAEDILAFYQETLATQGWEFDPEATLTNETGTAWFFKREEEGVIQTIRVLIAPKDDDTSVTVQWIYE